MSSDDVKCPYCGHEQEICQDDGFLCKDGETETVECHSCSKKFRVTASISFFFDAEKADCLNGAEHELEKVFHVPSRWPNWIRCKHCNYENRGNFIEGKP